MFSKPLATVLLLLALVTAAAGGAYVATRHNLTDEKLAAAGERGATPVTETEAAVTAPKTETKPAEAAEEMPARKSEPAPREVASATTVAKGPAVKAAPATRTPESASAPGRTVAANGASTPAAGTDQTQTAASATVAPKPAEPIHTVEPPQPEPVHVPQYDELILPASAVIGLQVETATNSERAHVEDRIDARVSRDVMAAGRVAIPAGSRVIGSVTTVDRGGKVKEQARLGIRFHTLVLADGTQVPLQTDAVYRLGESPAGASAKKIGGAAIGGAILGAILGGGKGAAIGGATGAGAGSAAVMAGDRNPATLKPGEYLNVKLASPATITVERLEQ